MKNKIIKILLASIFFLPIIVFAATECGSGIIPCDGTTACPCNFAAFAKLINNIINWFIEISATVAAITFSIAGAKMLLNPDNPGKRQEAVEMFKKTVIGMIIILVAWLVIHTVITTLVSNSNSALRFLKS